MKVVYLTWGETPRNYGVFGSQAIRQFIETQKLLPKSNRFDTIFKYISLEKGLLLGFFLIVFGMGLTIYSVQFWSHSHFGVLNFTQTARVIIPAIFTIIIGIQIVLFSFFFSILGLKDYKL